MCNLELAGCLRSQTGQACTSCQAQNRLHGSPMTVFRVLRNLRCDTICSKTVQHKGSCVIRCEEVPLC